MSNLSQFSSKSLPGGGGMKASIILFDAVPGTKTWTCPPGVSKVRVFAVGGGANGVNGSYSAQTTTGAGGGGGGFAEKTMTVTPGTDYTYVVGTTSGTSSFSTVCSATGAAGATGGQGISGDFLANGGNGGVGVGSGGGAAGSRMGNGGTGGVGVGYNSGAGGGGIGNARGIQSYDGSGSGGPGQGELWGTGIICGLFPSTGCSTVYGASWSPSPPTAGGPGCGGAGGFGKTVYNNNGYVIPGTSGGIGAGGGGGASYYYQYNSDWYSGYGAAGHGGIGGGGGCGMNTAGGGTGSASSLPYGCVVGNGGTGCVGIEVPFF